MVARDAARAPLTLGFAVALALAAAPAPAAAPGGAAPPRPGISIGDCRLEAPAGYERPLRDLAGRAATVLPQLERNLGLRPRAPYLIFLIPGGEVRDPEIAALDRAAPRWASGFLLPARRVGGIRMARASHYPFSSLESVLAHEATHMLLHDATDVDLPRWFSEGVAMVEERHWGLRDMLVYSSSLLVGALPRLAEMDRAFTVSPAAARTAYAGSFDFVSWARRRHGEAVVRDIVREAASRPFADAWRSATGETLAASEAGWRRGSLLLYRWIPVLTGTTVLWIGITLLALLAAARRRARTQAILARWDAEGDY